MPEQTYTYKNMTPSMAEMYQGEEREKAGRLVDEVIGSAPLLNYLDNRTTNANVVIGFRSKDAAFFGPRPYGFGAKTLKSHYESYTASMSPYDGKLEVEDALLRDAAAAGTPAKDFFAREGQKTVEAGLVLLDKLAWYGTDMMKYVSPGLTQLIAPYMTVSAKSAYREFKEEDRSKAEYKTACKDFSGTSVYFIVKKNAGLEVLWGNGSGINRGKIKDAEIESDTVDGEPGSFEGKRQHFWAKMGIVNHELYFIGRLKNVSADTGLTDEMIIDAMAEIFDGFNVEPTAIFMNKRARNLLRKSRHGISKYVADASSPTKYAKMPTEVDGVPIIVDINIADDETKTSLVAEGKKAYLATKTSARLEH